MVARLRLRFDGDLFGSERFCWGVHFAGPGQFDANPALLLEWLDEVFDLFSSHGSDYWVQEGSNQMAITSLNALVYGPTGPAIYSATRPLGSPIAGTGAPNKPAQISRCVSLGTDISSARTRGRVYHPALNVTMNGNGTAQTQSLHAEQFADFLRDCALAWPGEDNVAPVVYSAASDAVTAVSTVRVGNVLDTQRRRRDDIIETYTIANI